MEERIRLFLNVGSGFGDGSGYGYGDGSGDGYGDGYGDGSGYGYGDGSGISMIDGNRVYMIDDVPTIITHVRGDIAKGYILQSDLTLTPSYIVKGNGKFAHGVTLHEAQLSLREKLYDDSTEEERINAFTEHFPKYSTKYSAKELFVWHHVLTGSCKQGRISFAKDHNINIDTDVFTVEEFIELTINSYGGDVIKKLKEEYK